MSDFQGPLPEDEACWLDPTITDPAILKLLFSLCHPVRLQVWPVSAAVDAPGHDGLDLMAPLNTGFDF
ncbi:MAG: hypothetical protein KDJ22_03640 [Candidatus Competibacteraceae bacterium]|nr:hypothetical protein [Candidatus Competibacteraceae bacterium]MCP5126137.1 hypothetical protein [Gammaproteobacteria bacterium]HRX71213.1 hypothetical protein [Candidatus Competibacteraceae bacterium]